MHQNSTETNQTRIKKLRQLNEHEKLSLIFTQQRKLNEYEEQNKILQCVHQKGECVLCLNKDIQIKQLQTQIKQLQTQIEQLRHKKFGRSSERKGKGKGKKKEDKTSKQKKKRKRLPSEQFPDAHIQECTIEASEIPQCSECLEFMTDSGMRETAERIEYQPAELYIQRTHRVRYHCKCCQSPLSTAELPARLAPGTSIGDSLLIQACISKFYDLIPTTRYSKILSRTNAGISHKLLLKSQSIMATILLPVYQAIKEEILNSPVIYADETIHRQLQENKGKWRWYLWGFSNKKSVYFEIHDTRAGDVSIQFLMQSVVRFLVSDAYSGYNRTIREINFMRETKGLPLLESCLCNDHGRRYWFWAKDSSLAEKALEIYGKIYSIESKVQEMLEKPIYEGTENSLQALKLRQTADPLFNEIYNISSEVLMDFPEKSPEAVAARYFINHIEGLTLFLRHIELPISNALTERSIRDAVILRKISLGNHSLAGAEEGAVQLSVMGSCKILSVNPQKFLDFTKNRYLNKEPLLTPYQYKQKMLLSKQEKPPDS